MAGKSKFAIAEKAIRSFFDRSQDRIFSLDQISGIHEDKRVAWNLARSSSPERFLGQLLKKQVLRKLDLQFEGSYEKKGLYATQDATAYQVALAIHPKAYL